MENRPVGEIVQGWQAPPRPEALRLEGHHALLEPMHADTHAALIYDEMQGLEWIWDYMPNGPFGSAAQYHRWMREAEGGTDPYFLAIRDKAQGLWAGVASYLRITPEQGVIEVGNIAFSPALQKTRAATEAMVLMMDWAFSAGYRRYEWKCNALNMPSRRAAQRLGFSYEGIFRQHMVVKGRNRDTAWFAITDREWPALKEAFAVWLSPSNFDAEGRQRERLGDLTRLVRVASDPAL
ncbi:acetyltransferase [Pseudooceanicola nanhaiensis]|jgi:RimJ/RimL family protein N-acetyltransferase|uniref:Acetyltransferase n=1 Tax=Pseudooceanicola nanhaiensis TaxID=375761 RepID=A0A917STY5_9RHOB|nr:GNAT family protein [Pseudooceanicola nanhaiensis]GGL96096.1 acetyltransferase [Pseudooceanicola nanhaiensis]